MDRFRSGRSLSPIRQAEAYWLALARDGAVPRRTQIDPRALENVLPYIFILERIAPRVARFRLAGQHLCTLAGMDLRGVPLSALFTAPTRRDVAVLLGRLFDVPAIIDLTMSADSRGKAEQAEARAILLPLASDDGTVNRALGALIADPLPARPLRLDLIGHSQRPLPGLARPKPFTTQPPHDPALPGLAEAPAPLTGRPPWLKVVK